MENNYTTTNNKINNKNKVNYSLYLVTNSDSLTDNKYDNLNLIVKEAIKGGVSLVQLREKNASTKEFYKIAKSLKDICEKESINRSNSIPLIINDRIDILLAINGAGLHIGQDDMPVKVARKLIGDNKLLGVSTSTVEEAQLAEENGADYIGVGAVFPTTTKDNAELISYKKLKEIVESVNIPVVAIGGINTLNIEKLEGTGINGVSIVSAIMNSEKPQETSIELLKKVKKIL
ncbi:MAG: thiamine phosphate synthase [Methanobacteriaceae archaeon]